MLTNDKIMLGHGHACLLHIKCNKTIAKTKKIFAHSLNFLTLKCFHKYVGFGSRSKVTM